LIEHLQRVTQEAFLLYLFIQLKSAILAEGLAVQPISPTNDSPKEKLL